MPCSKTPIIMDQINLLASGHEFKNPYFEEIRRLSAESFKARVSLRLE